jgi:hypothetical protein
MCHGVDGIDLSKTQVPFLLSISEDDLKLCGSIKGKKRAVTALHVTVVWLNLRLDIGSESESPRLSKLALCVCQGDNHYVNCAALLLNLCSGAHHSIHISTECWHYIEPENGPAQSESLIHTLYACVKCQLEPDFIQAQPTQADGSTAQRASAAIRPPLSHSPPPSPQSEGTSRPLFQLKLAYRKPKKSPLQAAAAVAWPLHEGSAVATAWKAASSPGRPAGAYRPASP